MFALQDVGVERKQRRQVVRMRAAAELHFVRVLDFVSENFTAARADERVLAIGVDDQNQVGETVHEPAREFLLLVQAPLNFAPPRDVHQRALVAHDFAGVVADSEWEALQASTALKVTWSVGIGLPNQQQKPAAKPKKK